MTGSLEARVPGPLELEPMRWWDIPEVHELEAALFPEPWSSEVLLSELAHAHPDYRWYVVARDERGLLGYAGLRAVPPDADVQTIAVARRAQGSRAGGALLDALLAEAAGRGCTQVFLEVRRDNARRDRALRRARLRADRGAARLLRHRAGRGADAPPTPRPGGASGMSVDEPLVLGIETSCDETGVGLVRGTTLLADAVASSVDEHARFGGVVPEVASRAHLEAMVPTVERACADAGVRLADVDAVAVTAGPGLTGALLVGVAAAKALALALGKPALRRQPPRRPRRGRPAASTARCRSPAMALLVSGGHSSLLLVPDVTCDVRRSARPSTTRPARRSTRSRGCWGCPSRAGPGSTRRPPPVATRRSSGSRAG